MRVALKEALDTYPELADADFLFSQQVNLETIHTHDVVAERAGTAGELRQRARDRCEPSASHTELADWLRVVSTRDARANDARRRHRPRLAVAA